MARGAGLSSRRPPRVVNRRRPGDGPLLILGTFAATPGGWFGTSAPWPSRRNRQGMRFPGPAAHDRVFAGSTCSAGVWRSARVLRGRRDTHGWDHPGADPRELTSSQAYFGGADTPTPHRSKRMAVLRRTDDALVGLPLARLGSREGATSAGSPDEQGTPSQGALGSESRNARARAPLALSEGTRRWGALHRDTDPGPDTPLLDGFLGYRGSRRVSSACESRAPIPCGSAVGRPSDPRADGYTQPAVRRFAVQS